MPETDELALPYPEGPDEANVPVDIQALAERVEAILTAGHNSVWLAGDFKVSSRAASHGRWLVCDDRKLTAAEIVAELGLDAGDADALAALWGTGPTSRYDFDNATAAGKVRLPDAVGRAIALSGDAPTLPVHAMGEVVGEEEHLLLADEAGVGTHAHTIDHDHGHNIPNGVYYNDPGSPNRIDTDITSIFGLNYALLDVTAHSGASGNTGEDAEEAHNNLQPTLYLGNLFVRV